MACTSRRSTRHLIDEIQANGPGFRFFQAVRLLALSSNATTNDKTSIPADLRFGSALSLAFQPSEITAVAKRCPKTREVDENISAEQPDSLPEPYDDTALDMTVSRWKSSGFTVQRRSSIWLVFVKKTIAPRSSCRRRPCRKPSISRFIFIRTITWNWRW